MTNGIIKGDKGGFFLKQLQITAEQWLAGEVFTNNTMPLVFIFIGILFFVILISLLYLKKTAKLYLLLGLLVMLAGGTGLFAYYKLSTLTAYNELSKNESPQIRDRIKKPFTYEYTKPGEVGLVDIDRLDRLPFYSRHDVIEDDNVTYLGHTDYLHYFKIYRTLFSINLTSENIEISDKIKVPERVGYLYKLSDQEFAEIGFYQEVGPIYYKIVIPANQADKVYQTNDEDGLSKNLKF